MKVSNFVAEPSTITVEMKTSRRAGTVNPTLSTFGRSQRQGQATPTNALPSDAVAATRKRLCRPAMSR